MRSQSSEVSFASGKSDMFFAPKRSKEEIFAGLITEQQVITDAVLSIDPWARISLFGSRADDTKRGGDIDLLILSTKNHFQRQLL